MSAESVVRWNSIPLVRPEPLPSEKDSLKRTRGDTDDEDDISIVSRTPSPEPMDVDLQDIDKYDEYARGVATEVITVDTKIGSSNKGFSMLTKLGWVEGQPLGISGDGRVDPIPFYVKRDLTGLGKSSQDARMIESTVSQRRELDSERQQKESEEQRLARENFVARHASIQSELSETLKAFYCSVCEKQFTKVAQYDEHCNSYSHHHKIRFRDMQAAQRAKNNSQESIDKRKEKERKREEKELRKVAKAAGVKITAGAPIVQPAPASTSAMPMDVVTDDVQPGFKGSGWAAVPSEANSSGGFKKAGWTKVDSSSRSMPEPLAADSPPAIPSLATQPALSSSHPPNSFSGFRSGGWTSLESSPSHPELQPNQPQLLHVENPLPPISSAQAPPAHSGWLPENSDPPTAIGSSQPTTASTSLNTPPLPPTHLMLSHPLQPAPAPARQAETARSGWQQFKRGGKGAKR